MGKTDVYLIDPNGYKYTFNSHQNENPNKKQTEQPKVEQPQKGTPITGKSIAKVEQMIAFVKAKNPNAQDIKEIANAFLEVGNKYNIRGDIAFCQSVIETGWFKFDGGTAVTPDQHNYCGLGVTSKGIKGAIFDTVRDGVAAQIQHLFAYATKLSLPAGEKLLDPRFKYVTRGIAPNWEDLSNRWAMNANYGTHILNIYNQLLTTPMPKEPQETKNQNEEHIIKTPQTIQMKEVFFTDTEIGHEHYPSVIIDGKGYISVSDAAELMGLKALFDKVKKEIILIKR